jgi:hypothetical protein
VRESLDRDGQGEEVEEQMFDLHGGLLGECPSAKRVEL